MHPYHIQHDPRAFHPHDQRFFGPIGPLGAGLLGFGLGFLGGEILDHGPYPPYPPYPYPPYQGYPGPYGPPFPSPPYGPGPFYGPY
ncbi:hypothetical protein [Gracilibacillus sp. YIM 98692]|uniref:hypothetical protein n=1 Tax=Gracilibacillus sp. YIM 98692 TaxID=2663532 RepID=UPI0013D02726|nr:hypothetical protein [Gracilibacillus sp. YIM 98692]